MTQSVVIENWPFYSPHPLGLLVAPNPFDAEVRALKRANKVTAIVGKAASGTRVDADRHRVGVKMEKVLDTAGLLQASGAEENDGDVGRSPFLPEVVLRCRMHGVRLRRCLCASFMACCLVRNGRSHLVIRQIRVLKCVTLESQLVVSKIASATEIQAARNPCRTV
jgi:hypothetical protein